MCDKTNDCKQTSKKIKNKITRRHKKIQSGYYFCPLNCLLACERIPEKHQLLEVIPFKILSNPTHVFPSSAFVCVSIIGLCVSLLLRTVLNSLVLYCLQCCWASPWLTPSSATNAQWNQPLKRATWGRWSLLVRTSRRRQYTRSNAETPPTAWSKATTSPCSMVIVNTLLSTWLIIMLCRRAKIT